MKFERDPDIVRWLEMSHISESSFQWDVGNKLKNLKHAVKKEEIEELFMIPFVVGGKILEPFHPENRWVLFGRTLMGRKLSLIFTIRDNLIRPISCRPMRKEEARIYEEGIKGSTSRGV